MAKKVVVVRVGTETIRIVHMDNTPDNPTVYGCVRVPTPQGAVEDGEVKNIMDVTACYDDGCVYDAYSALRHKIAHKEIIVDMESRLLDYKAIIENMRNGGIRWLN